MEPLAKGGEAGQQPRPLSYRFGVFEFSAGDLALRRNGYEVKLQNQPALLLAYLLQRPNRLVTREELRTAIWPANTYVEFDFGLNTAISRLRRTLGDSAAEPRFIETVPKQGYRFVAPLEILFPSAPIVEATGPVAVAAVEVSDPKPSPEAPAPPKVHKPFVSSLAFRVSVATALLATLAAVYFWNRSRTTNSTDAPVIRYAINLPSGLLPAQLAVSPKGDQIAYFGSQNGKGQIYRRFLDSSESRPVPGSENGEQPTFSPDGSALAYIANNMVHIVREAGETVVGPVPPLARTFGFWDNENRLYFNALGKDSAGKDVPGIWRITLTSGSKPEKVIDSIATPRGWSYRLVRESLPGGLLLFSVAQSPLKRSIEYLDPADGSTHRILERGVGGQYLPATQHLVYYWNGNLMAAHYDAGVRKIKGSPTEVLRDVAAAGWVGAAASVSKNGTLVYLKQGSFPLKQLVWHDVASGTQTPLPVPPGAYEQAEVAPSGAAVAVVRRDEIRKWSVWILDLATRGWTRLAEVPAEKPRVVWSPDSKEIVFGYGGPDDDFVNLHRIVLANPQAVERLTLQPDFGQFPVTWSKAANAILFQEGTHPNTESDILLLPMDRPEVGGRVPKVLVGLPGIDRSPSVSPDGRWFAYSNDVGVYVQDLAQTSAPRLLAERAWAPYWTSDGKKIYFMIGGSGFAEIAVDTTGKPTAPMRMIAEREFVPGAGHWTRPYSVAPDGRLLISRDVDNQPPISQIQVVVNWFSELRRLAPVE